MSYEIYLFRETALLLQPLPYYFALVLIGFLTCWSIGVLLAEFLPERVGAWLVATGFGCCAIGVAVAAFVPERVGASLVAAGTALTVLAAYGLLFIPCVGFGVVFAQIVARAARAWGRDVGRFTAINTVGCASGVVLATMAGYEVSPAITPLAIGLGYAAIAALEFAPARSPGVARARAGRRPWRAAAALAVSATTCIGVQATRDRALAAGRADRSTRPTSYYGRDGVIEITPGGHLYWDGLWHSDLTYDGGDVGTNNWLVAVVPFLCHVDRPIRRALVVGLATGVTTAALARSPAVGEVDAYEINHTVARVLRDFPEGTQHVADNPRIHIRWEDARSGLALDPTRYDLITQQPTYLKQAGSSLLLSREYFAIVRDRLAPGGVFMIYANGQGNDDEAWLVRRTVAEVFPYYESFGQGYGIVASNSPIRYAPDVVDAPPATADPLMAEARRWGVERLRAYLDSPRLDWTGCPFDVTDDLPLVEYPGLVTREIAKRRAARDR